MTDAPPCGCEPVAIGDDFYSEHDGDCPRAWDHLNTAEGIAVARRYLMMKNAHDADLELTMNMADGLTARAVELGLEPA